MNARKDTVIFIPSLDPDNKLLGVVSGLKDIGFENIVLLDDGSASEDIFLKARNEYGCILLKHCVNLGKGRALKDGLNYIYNNFKDCVGVVTVDGDGQHLAKDTLAVAERLCEKNDCLIMGCRDFSLDNIPARSKFGNVTTSRVLKALCGISLSDTQTGLRGIPMKLIPDFVKISGERFEYELNMILETKEKNIPLVEVLIDTVYLEENESSHFNPLKDSIRIYSLFLKFIVASLSSSLVDIIIFTILCFAFKNIIPDFAGYILAATIIARICSAIFNFTVNKKGVFKGDSDTKSSAVKYTILAVVQCAFSAGIVYSLYNMSHINESVIKICVDTILFFISFFIQREWVFK